MIEICPRNECTGCQVCGDVCPVEAIEFRENDNGHIYPYIFQDRCIDCTLCHKTCPSVNPILKNPTPSKAIACWSRDKDARKVSTSGALSYSLCKKVLDMGGVFVGATWDASQNNAKHIIVDDEKDIYLCQGSKYSNSDCRTAYKSVKRILNEKKVVLFSGTPCQVAALKSYLRKDYPNLITVGLVCHGVPSRQLLRDRISQIEKDNGSKVIDYKSRAKTPNQYMTSCRYVLGTDRVIDVSVHEDPFFRVFVTNYGLRPTCFECKYACSERVEDITVADFWGYSPLSWKYQSYKKGTSLVLLNSEKGKQLFDDISDDLVIDYRSLQQAQSCNRNLVGPQLKPADYEQFWKDYHQGMNISELCSCYCPPIQKRKDYKYVLKTWIKMSLPNFIIKN